MMLSLAKQLHKYGWEIRAYLVLLALMFSFCSVVWFCHIAGNFYYSEKYDFPLLEFWPPFVDGPADRYLVSPFTVWGFWISLLLMMLLVPLIFVYPFLAARLRVSRILKGTQDFNS